MTDFIIRPPEEKDIEALARLHFYMWNEFYKDYVPTIYSEKYYTLEQCREYQQEMLQDIALPDKAMAQVAIDPETDRLVAICYLNQNDQSEDNDLYIPGFETEFQRLYIWPEYRNMGLGKILFSNAMNWLHRNAYRSCYTWTFDLNPYARFYPKNGSTIVKQMPRDYIGTTLNLTAFGIKV